jgi:UDP-N-acetylglucosamine:LPS N-acetylglucosamine transferase
MSLGSVVTDRFFSLQLGRVVPSHISTNDDGSKVMDGLGRMQTLFDMTGRDFMNYVIRTCFKALGGDDDYLVLLVCGRQGVDEVLSEIRDPSTVTSEEAGEVIPLPPNFLAFDKVPQLRVLEHADCFITHGGMGSTMEAMLCEVPMLVVPCFGDQPHNSESVERSGLGVSFKYPLSSLSPGLMREAVAGEFVGDERSEFLRGLH